MVLMIYKLRFFDDDAQKFKK